MSKDSGLDVPTLIATKIVKSAKGNTPRVEELAAAITDVKIDTAITTASFVIVTLSDPNWDLATSGFLAVDQDGLLDTIEIEYPANSGWLWILVAVDGTVDLSQANLTLTFESKIVWQMRQEFTPISANRTSTTRAQFIKRLAVKAGLADKNFICPELDKKQPVVTDATTGQPVYAPDQSGSVIVNGHASHTRKHKLPSVAPVTVSGGGAAQGGTISGASGITIKGSPASSAQLEQLDILLRTAASLHANSVATQALIFAAIAESGVGGGADTFTPNSAGYYGVLQGSAKSWPDPHDTAGMAAAFLQGNSNKGFQAGGAISLSRTNSNPIDIAVKVEVPGTVSDPNFYAKEAGYSNFLSEVHTIIAAFDKPGVLFSGTGGVAGSFAPDPVYMFQCGTSQNPDEDYWTCATRLAGEVNWFLFPVGPLLYYMNGYDLLNQAPHIIDRLDAPGIGNQFIKSLNYTFDNTAFIYQADHKKKAKVARKSRISKPQTPSQVMLEIMCDAPHTSSDLSKTYHAGDLVTFRNAGPINMPWVIADSTRNLKDTFTTLTLQPGIAPLAEPLTNSNALPTAAAGPAGASAGAPGAGSTGNMLGTIPTGSTFTWNRYDQGQDVAISPPGGPIFANGTGTAHVHSNAGGFGPAYVSVAYSTGPFAGSEVYYGHCPAVIAEGTRVSAGTQIAHTGTQADVSAGKTGNASVPGWLEIGYWPPGSMTAGIAMSRKLGNPSPHP